MDLAQRQVEQIKQIKRFCSLSTAQGEIMIKTRIASFALAASLFGGAAVGTVAAQGQGGTQGAGAAGVIAAAANAIVNLDVTDNDIDVIEVEVERSLNNLTALNNFLNNNDVEVTVQDVNVLTIDQRNVLNNAGILITDVVGVAVLSGTGDFIAFTR